jgi:acetyl-CoA carboxylase carboxyltransferase component
LQIKVATLKAKGEEITKEEEDKLLKEITDKYNEELSPYYAASRLWVDGIIDPLETRKVISMGIEAANHAPVEKFNVGVIQT